MDNITRRSIEASLLEQLHHNGADAVHFEDMVHQYGGMWEAAQGHLRSIEEHGSIVESATGFKPNPSVKELTMLNKQMCSLLQALGLTVDTAVPKNGKDRL